MPPMLTVTSRASTRAIPPWRTSTLVASTRLMPPWVTVTLVAWAKSRPPLVIVTFSGMAAAAGTMSDVGVAALDGTGPAAGPSAAAGGAFVAAVVRARVTFVFGGAGSVCAGSFGSSCAVGSVMSLAYRARRWTATTRFFALETILRYPPPSRGPNRHPGLSDGPDPRGRRSDGVETECQGGDRRCGGDFGDPGRPSREHARQPRA